MARAIIVSIVILTSVLSAQTTWTGVTSTNWATGSNWSAGVPSSGFDAVIAAGTPNSPSTSGVANAACRDLTINAGATLTIAPTFPLDVGRNLAVDGNVAGGGLLRSVTSQGTTLSGGGTIGADYQIAKTSAAQVVLNSNVTVNGTLTLVSGTLVLASQPNQTMTVTGNALMQGGTFNPFNLGILDVAGNVTFSGTTVTATPTIRCAGNFTGDPGFAPTSGTVVMDGVGAQSILGTTTFPNLEIAASSTTTVSSAGLVVNISLVVSGTLNASAGSFDANGSVTVATGATLNLGGGTDTIAGDLSVSGTLTATGTVVFDGASATNLAAPSLPNLQISKSGSPQVVLNSNVTVNGTLTLVSGTLVLASQPNQTMTVTGNALMQGGTFNPFNLGILDVAGNVTFSGTTVTATPTIRCAGNFTGDPGFAPTSGTVVMDGVGAQSILGTTTFPNLEIAASSTTTVSSAGLVVNISLVVSGTLNASAGSFDANGSVTVATGATLNLGGGTDTIAGDLSVSGTLTATGTVVFDGASATNLAAPSLPNLQISKSGSPQVVLNSNVTVNGSLTLVSGTLVLASQPNQTMTVTGNALMQGGALIPFNLGILDVAGNVTFSGTSVTATPTIRCAGNFTGDPGFAPNSGTVVMDGVGAQSILGTTTFPNLEIASSSTTTMSAAGLVVNISLVVSGTLNASAGSFDANGSVTVATGATLNLGGGTDTIAGDLSVSGTLTATGTVVFDGASATNLAAPSLPNLQISKSGSPQVVLNSNVTVNGSLTLVSGTLVLASQPNQTMTVTGNALMQGGALIPFNLGILDVAGNVTFSGTSVTATPTIRCAGNFTGDAAFAPNSGTVELNGAALSTIAHATPGGVLTFATLVIKNGTRTLANDFTLAPQNLTVDPNGGLNVAGGRHLSVHRAGLTAFNVNGGLSVAGASELSMGPQTTATIGVSGLLTLVGSPGMPAIVSGHAGGGYALVVNGGLAARDFVVKEAGAAGMVVTEAALLAVAPNNFQNGSFDFRAGAPAGSVLLDMRRNAPIANFDGCAFSNTPAAVGVFNVKTVATGVPFGFTNATGPFAGPSFEDDPNGLIAWNTQAPPTLAYFAVKPGAELAEVYLGTTNQTGVASYEIRRANAATGPFSVITTFGLGGPNYGHVDAPLVANQTKHYLVHAVMSQGDRLLIGSGAATPYSSATPGNIKKVGGNGTFSTIQAAINAATDQNSVIWVTPGTYPSFTIGVTAVPSNLRILGDDSGPVNIDTSSGPIQIMNVPPTSGIELSNLHVGTAGTAQDGIVISNVACPLVLDEVDVFCAATHVAISVSNAPQVAIQRSGIAGGTGLSVSAASYVAISRGSLSSLVSTGSTIEVSTLTPGSVNVSPPSSLITRTTLMPNINLPELIKLSLPSALLIDADPNAPFIVLASTRLGFMTGAFEMPFLLDAVAQTSLPTMFTDGLGQAIVGFEIEPDATLLGFSFVVQVVVGDPVTGASKLSNLETMVGVP